MTEPFVVKQAVDRRFFRMIGPRGSATRRAAVTMIDQCFASASNFVVGVVVAHIAGPAGLGAYSVAYTIWLVLGMSHRAIVTDPMSIESDAHQDDAQDRLQAGVAAEFGLGAVVAFAVAITSIPVIALGQTDVGIALLTLAPFLPFLLLQDYWRWVAFMQARPGRALANDTVFNCLQAALLVVVIVAGLHSASTAIIAWGVGAIAASIYGLRQFSVSPTHRGGVAMIGNRWHMSKWLLASGIASWGAGQAYPLFAGPAVGSVGLGGLKAAQSLTAGPALVLLQAGGSIGLPEASRGLETGGWDKLQRVARWVGAASLVGVGILAAFVFVAGSSLLDWIYGPEFVQYADTAKIIAFGWVVSTLGVGPMLTLKATRQTRVLVHVAMLQLVVATSATVLFSYRWGVNGTAWAMVLNAVVAVSAIRLAGRRAARLYHTTAYPSDPVPDHASAPDVADHIERHSGAEAATRR